MTRVEIEALIIDQFSGLTDKLITMGHSITNALKEIGQRHSFQGLKEIESDIDILSLNVAISDGAWDEGDLTLTEANAFDDYTFTSGDMILITAGTDTTPGWYTIASKTDGNVIVLSSSPTDDDQTDMDASWIGTPQYVSLPSGVNKIHGAVLINGTFSYPLDIRPKGYVDDLIPYPELGILGKPRYGYRLGDKLRLAPYTNTNYTVRLTTTSHPTLATARSSEPTLDGVENAVVARVLMDLYAGEEFASSRAYWEKTYERAFSFLEKNDRRKPSTLFKADGPGSRPGTDIHPNAVADITDVKFVGHHHA